MSLREKLFDMDYVAILQTVNRFEDKTKRDKELLGIKERLTKRLKGN